MAEFGRFVAVVVLLILQCLQKQNIVLRKRSRFIQFSLLFGNTAVFGLSRNNNHAGIMTRIVVSPSIIVKLNEILRGGGEEEQKTDYDEEEDQDEYDDEYDQLEYDENVDEQEEEEHDDDDVRPTAKDNKYHHHDRQQKQQQEQGQQGQQQSYNKQPYNYSNNQKKRKRNSSSLDMATRLAQKTLRFTSKAAWSALAGSTKAAHHLVSPKHVDRDEIYGIWRMDQYITHNTDNKNNRDESLFCAANIELTPRGNVIIKFQNKILQPTTPYLFENQVIWPQSCRIDFQARAFQGPNDDVPIMMRYRGYFQRKLADPNVIKMVGKIYPIRRRSTFSSFWKKNNKDMKRDDYLKQYRQEPLGRSIGTFIARKRLIPQKIIQQQDDEYDDEYDDDNNVDEQKEQEEHDYDSENEDHVDEYDDEDETDEED